MNSASSVRPFLIIAFTLVIGISASWLTDIDPVLLIFLRLLVGDLSLALVSRRAVPLQITKPSVHFWGGSTSLLLGFCINEWWVWGLHDAWGCSSALLILLGICVSVGAISAYLLYRGYRHCQLQERGYSGWGDTLRMFGLFLWGICYLAVSAAIILWAM